MRTCKWKSQGKKVICIQCKTIRDVGLTITEKPRDCDVQGWGTYFKNLFSRWGITSERISKVTGRPCGCPQRAKFLDRKFGRWK